MDGKKTREAAGESPSFAFLSSFWALVCIVLYSVRVRVLLCGFPFFLHLDLYTCTGTSQLFLVICSCVRDRSQVAWLRDLCTAVVLILYRTR